MHAARLKLWHRVVARRSHLGRRATPHHRSSAWGAARTRRITLPAGQSGGGRQLVLRLDSRRPCTLITSASPPSTAYGDGGTMKTGRPAPQSTRMRLGARAARATGCSGVAIRRGVRRRSVVARSAEICTDGYAGCRSRGFRSGHRVDELPNRSRPGDVQRWLA